MVSLKSGSPFSYLLFFLSRGIFFLCLWTYQSTSVALLMLWVRSNNRTLIFYVYYVLVETLISHLGYCKASWWILLLLSEIPNERKALHGVGSTHFLISPLAPHISSSCIKHLVVQMCYSRSVGPVAYPVLIWCFSTLSMYPCCISQGSSKQELEEGWIKALFIRVWEDMKKPHG